MPFAVVRTTITILSAGASRESECRGPRDLFFKTVEERRSVESHCPNPRDAAAHVQAPQMTVQAGSLVNACPAV
jgi:hypothetical protein